MRAWLSRLTSSSSDKADGAFTDEEMLLGVDHETTQFVAELSRWPMTWIEFPMEIVLQDQRVTFVVEEEMEKGRSPVPLVLSKKQVRHAELMLERVEELRKLRLQLCPRVLDEDLFWAIYFLLTKQHLRSLKLDQEVRLSSGELEVGDAVSSSSSSSSSSGLRVSSKQGKRAWEEVLRENRTRSIYKCILQQGCPDALVRPVLARLLLGDAPPESAARCYARLFGGVWRVPAQVLAPPLFGAALPTLFGAALPPVARRALCALALEHGHVWAPQLPLLLDVLARSALQESELLEAGSTLLKHALQVTHAEKKKMKEPNKHQNNRFLRTMLKLWRPLF